MVVLLDEEVFGRRIIECHPMEIELVGEDPFGGLFVMVCKLASFSPSFAVNAPENNTYQNRPDMSAHSPVNPEKDWGETVLPLLKKKKRPMTVKDIEDATTDLEEYHVLAALKDIDQMMYEEDLPAHIREWLKRWLARKPSAERNTTWPTGDNPPLKSFGPTQNRTVLQDGTGDSVSQSKDRLHSVDKYINPFKDDSNGDLSTPGMF
jgi:hypothetical protein